MTRKERGLGRGLDALLPSIDIDEGQIVQLQIDELFPCKSQPRKSFQKEALEELAQSIREHGVLQPVLVRRDGERYELIAGERRWRAARMAGVENIPALIKEMDDVEVSEVALIENLQREDLNVVEEAEAYRQILARYKYTQEQLAERVGKSRAHIANTLRLMNLPGEIVDLLEEGKLSAGHARALLALDSEKEQIQEARAIVQGKMTVRQVEEKVRKKKARPVKDKKADPDILALQEKLEEHFATRVELQSRQKGGNIVIHYYDQEQLERIMELLGLI